MVVAANLPVPVIAYRRYAAMNNLEHTVVCRGSKHDACDAWCANLLSHIYLYGSQTRPSIKEATM
jgi:hypothetical protein